MLAIHVYGTFYGTRAAARSMTKRGTGSAAFLASDASYFIGATLSPNGGLVTAI